MGRSKLAAASKITVPDPGDKDDFFPSFLDNTLSFVVLGFFAPTLRSLSNPETPAESAMAAADCEASATGG